MTKGGPFRQGWRPRAVSEPASAAAPTPSAFTGPAPAPSSRKPSRTASPATARAMRAASSGSIPRASPQASADEWVQPEPCAAPSGWRSPGYLLHAVAVEEQVRRHLAVAAGDHHDPGPEGVHRPRQVARAPPPGPLRAAASARLGVDDGHARHQLPQRLLGVGLQQARAALGHHHRVEHHGRLAHQVQRLPHRAHRLGRSDHPDLHGVDADVVDHRAGLLDDRLRRQAGRPRRRRPCSGR